MEKWPNFFIVGAPKAGTTSLYEYLRNVPDIYMSPIKEPNYFSINTVTENFLTKPIRDKKQYLKLFEKVTNEKIIGESSPEYLADQDAPSLIHQISPHAHILISIRDPVERAYSHYLMLINFDQTKSSFKLQIDQELEKKIDKNRPNLRLDAGMYSESVKRYLEVFGSNQVKVIIFEEFIKNTKTTIEEILHFLDLNCSIENFDDKIHNPSQGPRGSVAKYILTSKTSSKIAKKILPSSTRKIIREKILVAKKPKPKMDTLDRDTLVKFYEEDVKNLETLLGRKLPWKNFSTT